MKKVKLPDVGWLTHLTVAKILEDVYVNERIGDFIDQDYNDEVVNMVIKEIPRVIDYHMRMHERVMRGK